MWQHISGENGDNCSHTVYRISMAKIKDYICYNTPGASFVAQVPDRFMKQVQLGVPHSRIQVELGFILQAGTCQILNFAQNLRQSQSVQGTEVN